MWHVGQHYVAELTGLPKGKLPSDHPPRIVSPLPEALTTRVLQGLRPLSSFLIEQARRLHKDSTESAERRKSARENVPWDEVPDPRGLASALFEAVAVCLRGREPSAPAPTTNGTVAPASSSSSKKRKTPGAGPVFRNFAAAPEKKAKTDHRPTSLAPDVSERTGPSTVTTTELHARPSLPDHDLGDEDEADEAKPVPAEVRRTTQETRLVRLLRDEQGRVVRETRTVTTVIERVAWPLPTPTPPPDESVVVNGVDEPMPMQVDTLDALLPADDVKVETDQSATLSSILDQLAEPTPQPGGPAEPELVVNTEATA